MVRVMHACQRLPCLTTTAKQLKRLLGSGWDCDLGEGITDNQAEAWGNDIDSRQALSGMEAEL